MKALSLTLYTLLFSFAFSAANAQVSASSEPRGQVDQTGEVVILPFEPIVHKEEVAPVKAPAKQVYRNVAQKRDAKIGQMRNGYYQMAGNHDWGTSIRLNSFGYETTVAKVAAPVSEMAAASQPAEGSIAQTTASAETNLQVQPVAFK